MEATQQNLLRVNDIVSELEKRLGLAEPAGEEGGEVQASCKAEMREIELHAASHRFLELQAERRCCQAAASRSRARSGAPRPGAAAGDAPSKSARAQLEADTRALQTLRTRSHALENQVQLDAAEPRALEARSSTRPAAASPRREGSWRAAGPSWRSWPQAARAREAELEGLGGSWKDDELACGRRRRSCVATPGCRRSWRCRLERERSGLIELRHPPGQPREQPGEPGAGRRPTSRCAAPAAGPRRTCCARDEAQLEQGPGRGVEAAWTRPGSSRWSWPSAAARRRGLAGEDPRASSRRTRSG